MIAAFVVKNWPLVLVFVLSGLMLLWPFVQRRLSPVREIGTLDATRLINSGNPIVLDIREPKEFTGSRLPNAMHIPLSQLKDRGSELAKFVSRPVIVYCERGMRSGAATSRASTRPSAFEDAEASALAQPFPVTSFTAAARST